MVHPAQHPADERAVGHREHRTRAAALRQRRLEEPLQLLLVAERGDDLGGHVEQRFFPLIGIEFVEVAAAETELGLGGHQRRLLGAVVERDAAHVEQVARRLDVAVGVDLRAVGGDEGDGRRAVAAGRAAVGPLAEAGGESAGPVVRDAVAERFPLVGARPEGREREVELRRAARVLVHAVRAEVGELRMQAVKVEQLRIVDSRFRTTEPPPEVENDVRLCW